MTSRSTGPDRPSPKLVFFGVALVGMYDSNPHPRGHTNSRRSVAEHFNILTVLDYTGPSEISRSAEHDPNLALSTHFYTTFWLTDFRRAVGRSIASGQW